MTKFTPRQVSQIIRSYCGHNKSTQQIGERYGVSAAVIRRVLKAAEVDLIARAPLPTPEEVEKAKKEIHARTVAEMRARPSPCVSPLGRTLLQQIRPLYGDPKRGR